MISKLHKQNTNFQIAYFLAGSCHTPDGAYSLLRELREERQTAIDNYKVKELKNEAKAIRANKLLQGDEAEKLEGQAELLELENNKKSGEVLYQAALDEVAFIDKCLAVIEPLRVYKDLPDSEANEMSQWDEWKLELIRRAENFMLTTGGIPTDEFNTMRLHPDFQTEILPRINEIRQMILTESGREKALEQIEGAKFQEITKLLSTQDK
jgi:hypothetical protein